MARRTIRAATSFLLIPVLVLQTACMTALGPPMPINPGDQAQRAAIERAERVRVVTVGGIEYRLTRVELSADKLSGLTSRAAGERTVIPIDSISTFQPYKTSGVMFAVGIPVAFGVLLVVVCFTGDCSRGRYDRR